MKQNDHSGAAQASPMLSRIILALSLGGAFLISIFLDGGWSGVGLLLRSIIIVSIFTYLIVQSDKRLPFEVFFYMAMVVILSVVQTLRLSEVLQVLNTLAIFQFTLLAFLRASTTRVFEAADYIVSPWFMPFQSLSHIGALRFKSKKKAIQLNERQRTIARGIFISIPFVIIFGALFASADAVFSDALSSAFGWLAIDVDISAKLVGQIMGGFILFLFAAGMFSNVFVSDREDEHLKMPETSSTDRSTELAILLGSLNGLFLVFLLFQAVYLFGGADTVLNGELTYAEYGRRGFFELLAVASLVFLIAYNIYGFVIKEGNKRLRWLQIALIAQVGVVMISAIRRLGLYEEVFGFTVLRFYSHTFIFFLAAVFAMLLVNIAIKQKHHLVLIQLVMLLPLYLLALNLSNPDAFIAQHNLDRFEETGKIDEVYLAGLSQDAHNEKLAALTIIEAKDASFLSSRMCRWVFEEYEENYNGWRAMHFGADTARDEIMRELDCEPEVFEALPQPNQFR